jgi:mannose-6-phosphate isomerase-like protein (cupin superfamily)
MHIDNEHAPVREGQIVLIPPGSRQFISNTGTVDLVFLCIVAPEWQKDDEILCR